jgi:hypothetical protein
MYRGSVRGGRLQEDQRPLARPFKDIGSHGGWLFKPVSWHMPAGPILIFDKSALQALSLDESNWLDNFYMTNITPLFFAETLADLEKEVGKGKTPEEVVGHLAFKTPDMQAVACAHHEKILGGDLYGHHIPLDGRIPRDFGKVVELDGKKGVYFKKTPEEDALERWYTHQFLDVERQIAKQWRRSLCGIDHQHTYSFFQKWFPLGKPKNIAQVKILADAYIDGSSPETALKFGLNLLCVPEPRIVEILARWEAAGSPPIREFAPYFRHVFGVDLFFNLAVAADLISRNRPAGKADNKVDIAYLYYLPFCMIFVSNDKLHKRVVPLFLRDDQSFIVGDDLKADLKRLDTHYGALPEDVKVSGFYKFAAEPPEDASFLTTRLWDTHLPLWRQIKAEKEPRDKSKGAVLVAELNRLQKAAEAADPAERLPLEEMEFVQITHNPQRRKGKWLRFPDDV